MTKNEPVEIIDINSNFKLVFLTIVGLTFIFAFAYVLLCITADEPTDMEEGCAETLKTLITLGFGTVCGLVGGKSL